MELIGMGMEIGVGVGVGSSPPPSSSRITNPKKKRRTNNKIAQATQRTPAMQNFIPPPEFRNSAVANNPFDDTRQLARNSCMFNGSQQMHLHHSHNMRNPQMLGMNPLVVGNMNPTMFHMSNVNSMNSLAMDNQMNYMGNLLNTNHLSINNMNPMNNMSPNIPQGSMGPMNNHMNINHMTNFQMSGPGMNSTINGLKHDLEIPMGGPIGSPINKMTPSNIASNTCNVQAINAANTAMSYNLPHPHTNHSNNIRPGLNIPQNMPSTTMYSTEIDALLAKTKMYSLGMIKPQMPNIPNVNPIEQSNQMGYMGNTMDNITNNSSGKSSIHEMKMGNPMPQYGLQGPPALEPKQIPESSDKVYPPNKNIIFNDEDPDALPIFPCGICHKEVHADAKATLCESGCNFWFHIECTGLTENAYNFLMCEFSAEWVCDRCLQTKRIALVKLKKLKS